MTTETPAHLPFGGLRFAVQRGTALFHLHVDHLGSTSLTTGGAAVEASKSYYAYGAERAAAGHLQTDRTFTGQKREATGLMYYNARYYDPTLGTFVSPDSMVPNPARVIEYNRFIYARGNPLKYKDPSGHIALCFMGSTNPNTDEKAPDTPFVDNCELALAEIGYDEKEHGGERRKEGNQAVHVQKLYEEILKRKTGDNPSSEPVVLMCYSWGWPVALALARLLSGERRDDNGNLIQEPDSVSVDMLIMFDPVDIGHSLGPLGTVPSNVAVAVNYWAENAGEYVLALNQRVD